MDAGPATGPAFHSIHAQILDFEHDNTPSAKENLCRTQLTAAITAAIVRVYPTARVVLFGSSATGLALTMADLDLVVLGVVTPCSSQPSNSQRDHILGHLRKITQLLQDAKLVKRVKVICAKVPIAKFSAPFPGIADTEVDLCIEMTNGVDAIDWVQSQVARFVALRPMIFVLKRLLKSHQLDDPATGGCGGYLVVSLVVAYLKSIGDEAFRSDALDVLLLGFLKYFSVDFNYARDAIAAARAGGVMPRIQLYPHGAPLTVVAEDPQQKGRNITGAAHRFSEVIELFRKMWLQLRATKKLSFLEGVAVRRVKKKGKKGSVHQHTVDICNRFGSAPPMRKAKRPIGVYRRGSNNDQSRESYSKQKPWKRKKKND